MRAVRAAQLLDRGFADNTLSWLRPTLGTVDNLAPIDASPPNLRDEICNGKRKRPATDEDADTVASNGSASGGETPLTFFTAGLQAPLARPSELMAAAPAASEPVVVYTGPKKTGTALIAAVAVDEQRQTPRPKGKKARVAAKKPDAAAEPKVEAKPAGKEIKQAKSEAQASRQTGRRQAGPRQAGRRPEQAAATQAAPTKPPPSRPPSDPKLPTSPRPQPTSPRPSRPNPKRLKSLRPRARRQAFGPEERRRAAGLEPRSAGQTGHF